MVAANLRLYFVTEHGVRYPIAYQSASADADYAVVDWLRQRVELDNVLRGSFLLCEVENPFGDTKVWSVVDGQHVRVQSQDWSAR